jgi:hypothetical protein
MHVSSVNHSQFLDNLVKKNANPPDPESIAKVRQLFIEALSSWVAIGLINKDQLFEGIESSLPSVSSF